MPAFTSVRANAEDGGATEVYDVVGVLFEDALVSTSLAMKEDAGQPAALVTLTRVRKKLGSSPDLRHEFIYRAKVASNVSDEHFLRPMHAFVSHDNLYVVGEHAAGVRMSEVLDACRASGKKVPENVVLRVFLDVALGLRAHFDAEDDLAIPLRITHGDITSSNILVMSRGASALVHSGLTVTIAGLGKKDRLAYKAPEQLKKPSNVADATPAADVFAFGAALFEALSGGRDTERAADEEYESLPAETPALVAALVARCLSSDPAERFADARELLASMEEACAERTASESEVAAFVADMVGHEGTVTTSRTGLTPALPPVWRVAPPPLAPPPRTHPPRPLPPRPSAPPLGTDVLASTRELDAAQLDRSAFRVVIVTSSLIVMGMLGLGAIFSFMIKPFPRTHAAPASTSETATTAAAVAPPNAKSSKEDKPADAHAAHAAHAEPAPLTCGGDLKKNPKNCGVCGRDCLGGTCTDGVCSSVVLAKGQAKASNVTADAEAVYWTTNSPSGSVVRAPRAGGEAKVLASGQKSPDSIAVAGDTVYFATADAIMAVPTKGGTPKALAEGQHSPTAVRAKGGFVYWANLDKSASLMKVKSAGGAPEVVADHVDVPCDLAVDDDAIYFSSYGRGTISRAPVAGGAPKVLASKQSAPCGIAVNGKGVYWLNIGSAPAVMRIDAKGGEATSVASEKSAPVALALSDEQVYWTSTAKQGALFAAKLSGGPSATLLSNVGSLAGVHFADGVVFFTNYVRGDVSELVVESAPKPMHNHAAMMMDHAAMAEAAPPAPPASEPAPPPPAAPGPADDAGAAPAAGGDAVELTIASVGNTMAFNTAALTVKAGAKVRLTFKNVATMAVLVHNWVLVKPGTEAKVAEDGLAAGEKANYTAPNDANIIAATKLAKGGETVDVTFTAPAPGTYPFVCTMPGHYIMMKGKLTVTP